MLRNLENAARGFGPEAQGRALFQEAHVVQKVALERTPIDTGALRGSYVVRPPEISREGQSVKIEVGGPAAPYAVYVHERLHVRHPVGQAKYLESAVNEAARDLAERVAARLRKS